MWLVRGHMWAIVYQTLAGKINTTPTLWIYSYFTLSEWIVTLDLDNDNVNRSWRVQQWEWNLNKRSETPPPHINTVHLPEWVPRSYQETTMKKENQTRCLILCLKQSHGNQSDAAHALFEAMKACQLDHNKACFSLWWANAVLYVCVCHASHSEE